VTYSLNGEEVEYAYRGARWAPRPRKNSHLLRRFGYPSVVYLGANADRLTPRPDDFVPKRTRAAPLALIAAANQIFETIQFNNLKVINLTTGSGNQAFLIKTDDNPIHYHSEKHFSLGELCVIKLIEGIRDCPNESLILIDELEMALHPRAQIQLYRYLEDMAATKHLTIIFSTHSVSLLKSVPRTKIIFLDRDQTGHVQVVPSCFPTYAIGNITLGEEKSPDVVIYVEDEVAKAVVEPLVKLALQHKFATSNLFPDAKVIPIGAFDAVVQFLTHHGVLLPKGTRSFALLDNDVLKETVASWKADNKLQRLADFQKLGQKLDYLPWTPEAGIVSFLRDKRQQAERQLGETFGTSIWLDQSQLDMADGLHGAELRRKTKRILAKIADTIGSSIGQERESVIRILCQEFAKDQFATNREVILKLLLPKLA
jgi:hypothetical protein